MILALCALCPGMALAAGGQDRFADIYMPSSQNGRSCLAAFPGARDGEIYTSGGRGGKVFKVTTLADSGPGSLREAVCSKGDRTIVFEVAGQIELASPLVISDPNITIAGQTSPGGICLVGNTVHIRTDEVIIRDIDIAPQRPTSCLREMIVREGGWWNIIVDHCSIADGQRTYAFDAGLAGQRADSDGDGMPDMFEDRYGLDRNNPSDGAKAADVFRYTYTNLEYYLHSLVQDRVKAEEPARKLTIHLLGDSTMSLKPSGVIARHSTETGWGMLLSGFFDNQVDVYDFARNGLSTVTCISKGPWEYMLQELREGDYVFIQFGHNDSKAGTERYAAAWGAYQDNLRMMCRTISERGAHPVLLTSIARRHFLDGKVVETSLSEYRDACIQVARELGVPCFDLQTRMLEWLGGLGDVDSRPYYLNVKPMRTGVAPEGKIDNTHLQPAGARKVCGMVLDDIEKSLPELASHIVRRDYIVAQDGGGDFRTIQEAVDAAPDFIKQDEVRILIKPGIYREKVIIPASKEKLHLEGLDPLTTIISWDDSADRPGATGYPMGTSGTSTVFVHAKDFLAENICFENTAGEVGQACAITTDGDRQAYINCRFVGNQDTIYTFGDGQHQYFKDCWIEGTTDFIFGYSTCYFDGCTILSKKDSYITAASTLDHRKYGYVFRNCSLIHTPEATKVYLGRPWRKYAKTVFIDCNMEDHILPAGWHNWDKPYAEKTSFYAEYGSTGPGAASAKERVRWSHQLKARDLAGYEAGTVLESGSIEDKNGNQIPVEWYFKAFSKSSTSTHPTQGREGRR